MNLAEYLTNSDGEKSNSRLLSFMAFFPASIVLLWVHTETALGLYLSAFVFQATANKGMEVIKTIKGVKHEAKKTNSK